LTQRATDPDDSLVFNTLQEAETAAEKISIPTSQLQQLQEINLQTYKISVLPFRPITYLGIHKNEFYAIVE
jgi:hypothetical protein